MIGSNYCPTDTLYTMEPEDAGVDPLTCAMHPGLKAIVVAPQHIADVRRVADERGVKLIN